MTSAVSILPEQQLALLNEAYRAAVRRKRLRGLLATALFVVALVVAAIGAEVNLKTFVTHFGNFVSYFDRILTLDDQTRVWTNLSEWFWGWKKWLKLLAETILISYVGTLAGAALAFALNFFAGAVAALCGPSCTGIRPHGAVDCVRPDLCHRVRARADGGCVRDRHSLHRCAWKTVLRDCREHRHEAGRGRALHRRELDLLHALCRAAAGSGGLCQLCAAAFRDQCARGLGDGLCRRRRHRAGACRGDPKVLLFRRQRDPDHDHRHGVPDRHRDRLVARKVVRQGGARMSRLPSEDPAKLRERYPEVFGRPASSRLATPLVMALGLAIFVFGLVDLDFS